jgi:hypothetical protein
LKRSQATQLGKPVHRRDAEVAEKTQRKEMKRVTKKEKSKKRKREHYISLLLCVFSATSASLL